MTTGFENSDVMNVIFDEPTRESLKYLRRPEKVKWLTKIGRGK